MNTSATGGPLLPTNSFPPPLEGRALNRALQNWVAQLTGLPGSLVRPRWQSEPANFPAGPEVLGADLPGSATCWCAIGVTDRRNDTFPIVVHDCQNDDHPPGAGQDILRRFQELDCLASFYDLGVNGQADDFAALLRDGAVIEQNRKVLETASGLVFVYSGDLLAVPLLIKSRWQYRVDIEFVFRRRIDRAYAVLNLLHAQGSGVLDMAKIDPGGAWKVGVNPWTTEPIGYGPDGSVTVTFSEKG